MNNTMKSPPDKNPPDENEIEGLLSRFKPVPSSRFYRRMKAATWRNLTFAPNSVPHARWMPAPRLIWGLAILLMILLAGAIGLIPPIRAIARQIIYSFISAPSNQIEVQVTLTSPGDLFNYTRPSNFPLSLDEAQSLAGFQAKQILPLPERLRLVGARYDPGYHALILLYQSDQFTLFLTQRPLGNSQDVFSIGQEATVQMVMIGDVQGEFVRGGWKVVSTQTAPGSQTPESPVNITAVWDNALPQSTLRWQAGGMAYEIRAVGEDGPSQSDLINWANELK